MSSSVDTFQYSTRGFPLSAPCKAKGCTWQCVIICKSRRNQVWGSPFQAFGTSGYQPLPVILSEDVLRGTYPKGIVFHHRGASRLGKPITKRPRSLRKGQMGHFQENPSSGKPGSLPTPSSPQGYSLLPSCKPQANPFQSHFQHFILWASFSLLFSTTVPGSLMTIDTSSE